MILKFFPILEGKEYRVCYHDDENDLVTFSSDEELGDAMELMMSKSNTLKFTILLFPSENLQSEYEDNSRKSKLGRVVPKNAHPLPSSLSPQEAVAASALLHQNADSDSEEEVDPSTLMKRPRAQYEGDLIESDVLGEETGTKRRQCYPVSEKLKFIEMYNQSSATNKKPMKQFATEHGINQKTFSSWMKEYQDGKLTGIHPVNDAKRLRLRRAEYPDIENALIQHINQCDPNQTVSWSMIRHNALRFAKEFLPPEEVSNFKASDGWIQNFLKRNDIVLQRRQQQQQQGKVPVLERFVPRGAAPAGIEITNTLENEVSSEDQSAPK